uniref:CCHC-type domain-containing protein n=1 Tax=Chenopodium quinoa TaxID=63459 RepID=A0A803M747_CHEQI
MGEPATKADLEDSSSSEEEESYDDVQSDEEDYEKILYKMYIECIKGKQTVTEYTMEFLRYSERNSLGESENQKVALYISGLKSSLQDKMRLQTVRTVAEASIVDNDKNAATKDNPGNKSSSSSAQQGKATLQKQSNPYAKPRGDTCYRCNGKGHRSNVCQTRRIAAVVEGDGEELGRENDEYADVEFAEEEYDERVSFVLQRVLLTSKYEGQGKNLFKRHCSVQNKVCNLIVDNGSTKNFVSQKLVDYLKLPTEPHEKPYTLVWLPKATGVSQAAGKMAEEIVAVKEVVKAKIHATGQKNKDAADKRRRSKDVDCEADVFIREQRRNLTPNSRQRVESSSEIGCERDVDCEAEIFIQEKRKKLLLSKTIDSVDGGGGCSSEPATGTMVVRCGGDADEKFVF